MALESILAYAHLLAILTMVVFLTSEAALCRSEWMNEAAVERLAKIDVIYGLSAMLVLATGFARIFWGIKGSGYYWSNWLLYAKLAMFVATALLSIPPTLQFIRWRKELRAEGKLPDAEEVKRVRRLVMVQAHIVPIIPLAAVFLARGFGG